MSAKLQTSPRPPSKWPHRPLNAKASKTREAAHRSMSPSAVWCCSGRQRLCVILSLSLLALCVVLYSATAWTPRKVPRLPFARKERLPQLKTAERQPYWRNNLLPEVRYITGGQWGGTSNQFHGASNLIYLGLRTRRVPILPHLEPGWVDPPTWAKFSDFWDLQRFTESTSIPLLEISEVRDDVDHDPPPPEDHIGCWSSNELMAGLEGHAWANTLLRHNIHIDHWPLPPSVKSHPEDDGHVAFMPLQLFDAHRSERNKWLDQLRHGDNETMTAALDSAGGGRGPPDENAVPPDDQLLCFDNYFYMQTTTPDSPAFQTPIFGTARGSWEEVGQHLHWNKRVDEGVDTMVRRLLGWPEAPFLGIHVRRGDFGKGRSLEEYNDELKRLRDDISRVQLASGEGPTRQPDLPVIVVTDEVDDAFQQFCRAHGWHYYDHGAHETVQEFDGNPWWPSILDAALLSRANGIIGTGGSTYSYQAILRAQAWQGAAFRWVT